MSGSDFWSRRKAAVEAETETATRAKADDAAKAEQATFEGQTDHEILAALDLPDPETLEAGDDFTAFLKSAVPERLKRVALRRLWATNPVLANLDGLIEYGEDYTDAATVVENLATTYQVGKGMAKHVERLLEQAAEAEADGAADDGDATDEPADEAAAQPEENLAHSEIPPDTTDDKLALMPGSADGPDDVEEEINYPSRRKMQYKFHNDKGGAA